MATFDEIALATQAMKPEDYYKTFDIGKLHDCSAIKENRYRQKVGDKNLYCWKGLIRQKPECVIGHQCDEVSYYDARSRFCLTWGGCDPYTFVGNPSNEQSPVLNPRGGIVTYNSKEECQKANGFFHCLFDGLKQSIDNASGENRSKTAMALIVGLGALLGGTIIVKSHPKLVKGLKSSKKTKKYYHI